MDDFFVDDFFVVEFSMVNFFVMLVEGEGAGFSTTVVQLHKNPKSARTVNNDTKASFIGAGLRVWFVGWRRRFLCFGLPLDVDGGPPFAQLGGVGLVEVVRESIELLQRDHSFSEEWVETLGRAGLGLHAGALGALRIFESFDVRL